MTDPYCLFEMWRDSSSAVLATAGTTLRTGCKWGHVIFSDGRGHSSTAQRYHQIKWVHVLDCLCSSSSRESCPCPRVSVFFVLFCFFQTWLGRIWQELVSIYQETYASSATCSHAVLFFWEFSSFFLFVLRPQHFPLSHHWSGDSSFLSRGVFSLFVKSLLSRGCVTSMLVACTVITVAWPCSKDRSRGMTSPCGKLCQLSLSHLCVKLGKKK